MKQIFQEHNVDTPYIEANYKTALRHLEQRGEIVVDPPAERRQVRNGIVTFADRVLVTFPPRR
jgi:hypothetical protein